MSHTGSECVMKTPGDLVSFVHEEYRKYKDGAGFPVRDKIRTRLPTRKTEEMHTTHLQLMQLLQLAIISLPIRHTNRC